MIRVALVAVVMLAGGACKKQEKAPRQEAPAEMMSADEIKRSEDACNVYVERVCSCAQTVPAAVKECELAKAQPEAIRLALEVASSPDSKPIVVRQTLDGVRKTVKVCIEETAKLPTLGCP